MRKYRDILIILNMGYGGYGVSLSDLLLFPSACYIGSSPSINKYIK